MERDRFIHYIWATAATIIVCAFLYFTSSCEMNNRNKTNEMYAGCLRSGGSWVDASTRGPTCIRGGLTATMDLDD